MATAKNSRHNSIKPKAAATMSNPCLTSSWERNPYRDFCEGRPTTVFVGSGVSGTGAWLRNVPGSTRDHSEDWKPDSADRISPWHGAQHNHHPVALRVPWLAQAARAARNWVSVRIFACFPCPAIGSSHPRWDHRMRRLRGGLGSMGSTSGSAVYRPVQAPPPSSDQDRVVSHTGVRPPLPL